MGANGSGKTTLLHHLNGLLLPQQGKVKIFGQPVDRKSLRDIRTAVGLLFDNPDNQLFSTTVYNDIAFGPRNLNLKDETVDRRVQRVMDLVEVEHLKDKPPFNLSLGQKKKVAIAGILAMEPQLLLFDEPFSGLDPASARQVIGIMDTLYKQGCTMVVSTHDVNMAYGWADEILVLNNGEVIARGSVDLLGDRELMAKAQLEMPMLVEIFQGIGLKPRTVQEANRLLSQGRLRP